MTTEERLEVLERELAHAKRRNRWLLICAAVCLGLIFAWVLFAQPGLLGTAQASDPANPYEAEITRLQAEVNLLKRENDRLRKELDEAKKDKSAAAPTDAQGPSVPQPVSVTQPQSPAVWQPQTTEGLQSAVYERDPETGELTRLPPTPRIPTPLILPKGITPAGAGPEELPLYSYEETGQRIQAALASTEVDTLRRKEKESWNALVEVLPTLQDPEERNKAYQKYRKEVSYLVSQNAVVQLEFQHYLSEVLPQREAQFNAIDRQMTVARIANDTKPAQPPPPPPPAVPSRVEPTAPRAVEPAAPAVPSRVEPTAPAKVEPQQWQCPTCMGTGHLGKCPYCEGTGHELLPMSRPGWPGEAPSIQSPSERITPNTCTWCKGTGMKPCPRCGGKGVLVWRPVMTAPCPKCNGTGRIGSAGQKPCSHCNGTGTILMESPPGPPTHPETTAPCPKCKGTGKIGSAPCDFCDGTGELLVLPPPQPRKSVRREGG